MAGGRRRRDQTERWEEAIGQDPCPSARRRALSPPLRLCAPFSGAHAVLRVRARACSGRPVASESTRLVSLSCSARLRCKACTDRGGTALASHRASPAGNTCRTEERHGISADCYWSRARRSRTTSGFVGWQR
jgi:hypothetical protein